MNTIHSRDLSDEDLLVETRQAAGDERCVTVRLIELLAEVDARRLYLGESCPSLFVYCTRVLRLAESASYRRITAARLCQRFPAVLPELAAGSINLTTTALLGAHLTPENCDALLAAARHKSKNDVERLVAGLAPQPDISSSVRKLPAPRLPAPAESVAAMDSAAAPVPPAPAQVGVRALHRPALAPLAADRHLMRVTVSGDTRRKLERAQELLRHAVPNGDAAEILDRALTLLVEHLEKTRLAAARRPRKATTNGSAPAHAHTRHIPAAVKRAVWARDEGRCAFVGANGRCDATGFLEWHHIVPFAVGGGATRENLELRCRPHNAYEAALYFVERAAHPVQSQDG